MTDSHSVGVRRLDLEQGSDEWREARRQYRPASLAAVAMGCAPPYWRIRTVEQLRAWRRGDDPPDHADAFRERVYRHGHEQERRALAWIRRRHADDAEAAVLTDGVHLASLDALDATTGCAWEIKSPWHGERSTTWRAARQAAVDHLDQAPPHYRWQLVQQGYLLHHYRIPVLIYLVWIDEERWISIPILTARCARQFSPLRLRWEEALPTTEET